MSDYARSSHSTTSPTSFFNRIPNLRFLLTRQWLPLWILGGCSLVGLGLFALFHKEIISILTQFADVIKGLGFGGLVLMVILLFLTCFPPLVGYGTLLYMFGFIYGFPLGFFPAYLGAWSGGVCCFLLARRWMGDYYRGKILRTFPKFEAIEDAIEKGGLKLTVMIRLAPYPWSVMSVLFATTSITLSRYIQATSIALLKIILHIYIGASVRDLAETTHLSPARVFALSVGLIIAIGVFIYLTLIVKRALREVVDDSEEVPLTVDSMEEGRIDKGDDAGGGDEIVFDDTGFVGGVDGKRLLVEETGGQWL